MSHIASSVVGAVCSRILFSLLKLTTIVMLWVAGVVSVNAQSLTHLDTVVVAATKSERTAFDYPGIVNVIDSDDASVAGAAQLSGLFRNVAGIEFDGSARRNGSDIRMRGYGASGLVVLFDGVRQKFESAHEGRFQIDPNLIQSVEVVKGPGSALYGAGALGGVIAFKTKDAADLIAPGERQAFRTTTSFDSVNDDRSVSLVAAARGEVVDGLVSVVQRKSGDIKLGDGSKLSSKDDIISSTVKLGWSLDDFSTFKTEFQHYRNDAQEPNSPGSATSRNLFDKRTKRDQWNVRYSYKNPDRPLFNPLVNVWYQDAEVMEKELVGSNPGRTIFRGLKTTGINLENRSYLSFQESSHNLIYGVERYTEKQNGDRSAPLGRDSITGVADGIPDAEADYSGVFIQDEIELGKLLIIPGLRYDSYKLRNTDAAGHAPISENAGSPKLNVRYQLNDNLLFFANWAKAFRAPEMTEAYASGVHFPGNVFIANPTLKPEKNESREIGFGLKFVDSLYQGDEIRFKAARYQVDAEDFIDTEVSFFNNATGAPNNALFACFGPPTRLPPFCSRALATHTFGTKSTNIVDAELRGTDIEVEYAIGALRASLGYSQLKGTNRATGAYLTNITPPTYIANLSWNKEWYTLGLRATHARAHTRVNNAAARRGAYRIYDIYAQWVADNGTVINAGIDNLFDESYERVFAGSKGPGRNVKMGISYQW